MTLNQINLYGVIGEDVRAIDVKNALAQMDQTQPLLVRIDSEGGSVFDGFSIANAFADYAGPKKAIVEPQAMSIASYIVAVFDDVEIAENGYLMAHLPYAGLQGTAEEFASQSTLLADLQAKMLQRYSAKMGVDEMTLANMLKKDTYWNAQEALAAGLVTSVSPSNKTTRVQPQAKHRDMPTRVYASLFGSTANGDNREPTREKSMSNAQPVAATVQEIKAAYPKAKAEFVLSCIERSLPLAQVQAEMMTETMSQNDMLTAKCQELESNIASMQTELAAAKAAMEIEVSPEEEQAPVAAPVARGAKPVARATSNATSSAKAQWDGLVEEKVKAGMPRPKAVLALAKTHESLRQQMLSEVNV